MSGFKDFHDIIQVLESEKPDSRVLCGFLEKVHVQAFQEPHFAQLEEVFMRLQRLEDPGALIGEELVGALARAYDNLVTGNLSRPEVLSLNLQLLYVIDDLCEHPEGKTHCGKLFITRLLALICAKAGSLQLKRASVDTLGALITRSADNQKYLVVHSSGCYKLFKMFLPKCGDFQLQASTAEILFRLTRKHRRLLDVVDDEAAKTAMLALHEAEKPDLVSGIRNFVGLINNSMGAARSVHSFRALDASLDDKRLLEEVWVHVGLYHFTCHFSVTGENMTILDFSFSDIKEIKRELSSHLEIVVCKEANAVDVFSRQRLRFRFSTQDLDAAYDCFHTKLATVNAAPTMNGRFSVGIHVPLPKASDFPPNEDNKGGGNENVSQLRSKLMAVLNQGKTRDASPPVHLRGDSEGDTASPVDKSEVGCVHPRAEQRENKFVAPTVQKVDREKVVIGNKGHHLGGKHSPTSPSRTAAEQINLVCQPTTKQENASPGAVETDVTIKNKAGRAPRRSTAKAAQIRNTETKSTSGKVPDVLDFAVDEAADARSRAEKKRPGRAKLLKKQKSPMTSPRASGRKKSRVVAGEVDSTILTTQDSPAAAVTGSTETAADKTRAGRKRQCNALNCPVTAEATKDNVVHRDCNARRKPVMNQEKVSEGSLANVFDFTAEDEMNGKRRNEQDGLVDFLKASGVENADQTRPDDRQKRSEATPLPSVTPAQYFDISEDDAIRKIESTRLKRERLDSPNRFFEVDADGGMRAALAGRRSRQRKTYCSAVDSPIKVSTRSKIEESEDKMVHQVHDSSDEDNKVSFRAKHRIDSPVEGSADDEVEEVPGDFIFLLVNLLKKFKQKVQSRVRGKTTQILSLTSEAIKSDAVTLEFQIHNDIETYMQCCKSKLGDIELQLHDENVRFKEFCDSFEREFKDHCSRLDQMQSQVDCAEDELKALSDRQRLAHRKLMVQMLKTSEERLKEAESKILAIKKAARRMEGLREAFHQLLEDNDP